MWSNTGNSNEAKPFSKIKQNQIIYKPMYCGCIINRGISISLVGIGEPWIQQSTHFL